MLNCENCINEEYKDELICCIANHFGEEITKLKKQIPFIGKHIKEHECVWYEPKGE